MASNDSMEYLPLYVVLTLATITATTIFLSDRLTAWVKLKKYQYEATFALSMMNPRERFVCNSIVFLTFSMLIIAASLYLPDHIATMTHRAFYYWSGKTGSSAASSSIEVLASRATVTANNMANQVAQAAVSIAKGAATPVGSPVSVEAVPAGGMGL